MAYPYDSSIDNSTKIDNNENLAIVSKANYAKNTKIYGDRGKRNVYRWIQ